MNKKGFTIIELLSTIVVIALIMGIAVVAYTAIVNYSKIRLFKTYEETMHVEAVNYVLASLSDSEKANRLPVNGGTSRLMLSDLRIDPIINPVNKEDLCSTSYVDVTRDDYYNENDGRRVEAYKYKVCLICTESDYNVTGDNCVYFPEQEKN